MNCICKKTDQKYVGTEDKNCNQDQIKQPPAIYETAYLNVT